MAEFRTTPGGSLEVLQDGVWVHVPRAAADEIESLRVTVTALREQNWDALIAMKRAGWRVT